jgi:hypothetical protein
MTPSSQLICLETMQIFLCEKYECSRPLAQPPLSFHVTSGHDLGPVPYGISGFFFSGVFTPFNLKNPMLDLAKWPIQIDDWTRFEFDGQDQFLEQLQSPTA